MRALFDVNVLIALFDPSHLHHELAHGWLKANLKSGWASCPLTQNGCIRILCQPAYPNAISPTDAVQRVRSATAVGEHEFWSDDISLTDPAIFDEQILIGSKAITDLYLLGLALRNQGRLVTFDRGINSAAVIGATEENLIVLGSGQS